ncbi:MAG: hypothetical protein HW377_1613, partial [Actinobacteria bacterium]|nr:hypothetical protein [Actinomycetota bacterium]
EGIAQWQETAKSQETAKVTGLFGGSAFTNPYISLVVNTFFYSSALKQGEVDGRSIPGFTNIASDGRNRGFNFESAELFLFAPVDPYFNLYANIPVTDEGASVEEAYFLTTSLPAGFQIKGGKFKGGFGRINGQHPHACCLPPLPFYLQLGIEVFQGENELLFDPYGKSPFGIAAFAKASFDVGEHSTVLFGPSFLAGKARIATVADDTFFSGTSELYGFELVYKWKPSRSRSLVVQSEYMVRRQNGDLTDSLSSTTSPLSRTQDGIYVQGLYQWERWRIGVRYDVLELFRKNYILSGLQQDFGKQPWRVTGAVEFNPTEFSRLRLQYNRDDSARNGQVNYELFFQVLLGIGAHAAHAF